MFQQTHDSCGKKAPFDKKEWTLVVSRQRGRKGRKKREEASLKQAREEAEEREWEIFIHEQQFGLGYDRNAMNQVVRVCDIV